MAKQNSKMNGTIVSWSYNNGWGFIRPTGAPEDKSLDRFFHKTQINDGINLAEVKVGQEVEFGLGRVDENPRICAVNIEIIN